MASGMKLWCIQGLYSHLILYSLQLFMNRKQQETRVCIFQLYHNLSTPSGNLSYVLFARTITVSLSIKQTAKPFLISHMWLFDK